MSTITLRSTKGTPLTNTEVDNNFSNLNSDKYESGSSPSFVDVTVTGTQKNSTTDVTAAGTVQADATALTKTANTVTAADGTKGVRFPNAATGLSITVNNTGTSALKVYPASGHSINDLAANAAYTLPAKTSMQFYCKDNFVWLSVTPLVIYDSSGTRLN